METPAQEAGATLLINLTRFGDLLQSQPLIEELHRQGRRVHLLCLENFSGALPLLRHVERAWPLPGARLMSDMDKDWRTAAARLLGLARRIRAEARPASVINLTTTLPARLLAGLICDDVSRIRGFCLDREGFGRNNGVWASFLNGTTANRLSAPFNIVDMFRMVGNPDGTSDPARPPRLRLAAPSPTALARADALLSAAPAGAQGYVCLQPGASEARRQWPARFFAAVGDRLWRELRLCPVLLGSPAEAGLGRAYEEAAQAPCVNAIGKTDLETLAALICRSRLLITNDTGTMHLAAGLGTACLAIFLATAQPCDTGPYLPGCCCLEPALPCHPCPYNRPCPHELACVTRISPQRAGDLALARLVHGTWDAAPLAGIEQEARIWLTDQDDRGFALVRRLTALPPDDRSLWLAQQRFFWRQLLDDMTGMSSAATTDDAGPTGRETLPEDYSDDFVRRVGDALAQAERFFGMLTEQGRLVGRSPLAGQLFLRNCERLQAVLEACPELRALGGFWRELRQERGGRMDDLLALTALLGRHIGLWRAFFKNGTQFA
ncbi:MAG: glycosyltransferase family 9 protein [Desulfovibrio sp.]|nr:glycosyltransferase family 9 protein [Desulfovibrio sp.]